LLSGEKGKRDDRIHVLLGEVGESTPSYRRKFAAIRAFSGARRRSSERYLNAR
jgi:hypothetical protein